LDLDCGWADVVAAAGKVKVNGQPGEWAGEVIPLEKLTALLARFGMIVGLDASPEADKELQAAQLVHALATSALRIRRGEICMVRQADVLGGTTVVVDSFSLYSIAVGHLPSGPSLRDSAHSGEVRLVTSAVALAVASSMRTCWDDACDQDHPNGADTSVQEFHERGGVEVVDLTAADAVSAGRLYAGCTDRRVGGAEVLAACHSVLLAKTHAATLLSTVRASYCYVALADAVASHRIELI